VFETFSRLEIILDDAHLKLERTSVWTLESEINANDSLRPS
jgi:hypothetical protein